MHQSISIERRQLLRALGLAAGTALMPKVWAQGAVGLKSGRLIIVFLRGAYDGLSAAVPYADPAYARLRPSIAIAAPDGSATTAIKLDATFALHPALAPLMPLWHSGVLSFIPAAGSPDPSRSHFEAQNHWEIGIPGKSNAPRGWLNTLAAIGSGGGAAPLVIGVGEANPKILSGPAPVRLFPKGKSAAQEGVLGNQQIRQALMDLYAGPDAVSSAFRQGAGSRMISAQELNQEMMASDNGASSATGFLLDARHLGTLMRNDRRLRLGFLSAGGWDTHANQGAATGALSQNLGKLGQALVQLRQDFSETGDVIAVISEFGRTAAENGTRGTDHGHGNTLWLIGSRINGGRWHGQWTGLANGNLHETRDLPVHHDFRSIFSQILHGGFGITDRHLQDVFPGSTFDKGLAGLIRS